MPPSPFFCSTKNKIANIFTLTKQRYRNSKGRTLSGLLKSKEIIGLLEGFVGLNRCGQTFYSSQSLKGQRSTIISVLLFLL